MTVNETMQIHLTVARIQTRRLIAVTMVGVSAGCEGIQDVQAQNAAANYKSELLPLNVKTSGHEARGEAIFTISGDELTIRVTANGVPPDIEHLQHFHGFATGDRKSKCPSISNDANGDGIIDLIETEAVAGTTMVPFHDDPVSMEVVKDTYPKADARGSYNYEKTLSLKALQDAFAAKFPDQQLDLNRRVVFLHGVPTPTKLPGSVASLGDIPAQVTLPIACGEITKSGD